MESNAPGFTWLTPVLCVDDVPKSLQHYVDVLGFAIEWQWSEHEEFDENAHATFACVRRGECCLFLCEQGQGNPGTWICMNVKNREDLDAVLAEYRASGAKIVEEPRDCPWGMREMLVQDPDGNTFRIGCVI